MRIDQERQAELEPKRLQVAKLKLELLGYDVTATKTMLEFVFNVSVLYDVADFQQKAQYEAPKLNLK